jgi:hypothetical protein
MKKLNYLLASIFLLISMGAFAQVDVEVPPCVTAKTAMSKQEKKDLIKGFKGKKDLPEDLFKEEVIVFILNDRTANIGNVIKRKPKGGNYSFSETIREAKEAFKSCGLKVSSYVIDEMQSNISREHLISSSKPEEDMKMVNNLGAKYYVLVSDDLINVIINTENPLDIFSISSHKLSKEGDSENYKEGKTINRIPETFTYGGKYELSENIKVDKIYFVFYPNFILPKSKPKGLMCKMSYNYFVRKKEENLKLNSITEKELKKCKVEFDLVDKESEIKAEQNDYILKYYEYNYIKGNGDGGRIEAFYLENIITKKVYAFKSGTVSNKYDKYLEKVIKGINEH